jgi:hypothetical protein
MKHSKSYVSAVVLTVGAMALAACSSGSSGTASTSAAPAASEAPAASAAASAAGAAYTPTGPVLVDADVTAGKVDLKGQKVVALFTSLNNDYYAGWARGAEAAVRQEQLINNKIGVPLGVVEQFAIGSELHLVPREFDVHGVTSVF